MTGERDLKKLLQTMKPEMQQEVYVFCSLPKGTPIPANLEPVQIFRESEGTAFILKESDALKAGLDHQYPSRQITLTVRSSLDAVGFLAAITAALVADGISVNPVSAFYHDHLFVPKERADDAMRVLKRLATPVP